MESNRNTAMSIDLSKVRMSPYERAMAEQQMAQAMALVDLGERVVNGVRAILGNAFNVLAGAFAWKRDFVKNGVVHFD